MRVKTGSLVAFVIGVVLIFGLCIGLASYAVYQINHPAASTAAASTSAVVEQQPAAVAAPCPPPTVITVPGPVVNSAAAPVNQIVKPDKRVALLVIGGGIGGHAAMYEAARGGVGTVARADKKSKNTGLLLIEKSSHPCGIIRPITFHPESKWDNLLYATADEQAYKNPYSPNYKPYRVTPHANFVPILTAPGLRCLANELGIPIQQEGDTSSQVYLNGKLTRRGRFNYDAKGCSPDSPLWEGAYGTNNGGSLFGLNQAVNQLGGSGFNIYTVPEGGDIDIMDTAIGWMSGITDYTNPTYNYSGDGTAFNNATPDAFDVNNPNQDHPRWTCGKYKDLTAIMNHYFGMEYTDLLVRAFFGFHDFNKAVDPCSYFGKGAVDGYNTRDWLTAGSSVPVGSMTEFCTRMRYHVANKTFGAGTATSEYLMNQPAQSIALATTSAGNTYKGKYVVETPNYRIYADNIIINAPASAIEQMTGNVRDALVSKPQFDFPRAVKVAVVIVKWNNTAANLINGSTWMQELTKNVLGSFGHITDSGCLGRFNIFDPPYWKRSNMTFARAAYTDQACVAMWERFTQLDNPLGQDKLATGLPLNGAAAQEVMRQLRLHWASTGPHANLSFIPDPEYVYVDIEADSWFYGKAGSNYSSTDISQWALRPLGVNENIALVQQGWNIYYSGWVMSSIDLARRSVQNLFPYALNSTELLRRTTCGGVLPDNNAPVDWSLGDGYGTEALNIQKNTTLSNEVTPNLLVPNDPECWIPAYGVDEVHGSGRFVWNYAPNYTMLKP